MRTQAKMWRWAPVMPAMWVAGCGLLTSRDAERDRRGDGEPQVTVMPVPIAEGSLFDVIDLPPELAGETGYGESTTPLCPETREIVHGVDIYAEADAVYMLSSSQNGQCGSELPACELTRLHRNEGRGWETIAEQVVGQDGWSFNVTLMLGRLNGSLVGTAPHNSEACTLTHFEAGQGGGLQTRCERARVRRVFVTADGAAFAVAPDNRLVRRDGETWRPIPAALPFRVDQLWSDGEVVFAAGGDGVMLSIPADARDDERLVVHDTQTIAMFISVWGTGPRDVWALTADPYQLMHFDGETWRATPAAAPCDGSYEQVEGEAGRRGEVWLRSSFGFARAVLDRGGEIVLEAPVLALRCPTDEPNGSDGLGVLRDMSVRAIDEVFFNVSVNGRSREGCGEHHALRWDGALFHWF